MYYLIGGSGAPNYGDELIMLQWLRFLHEEVLPRGGATRVVVDNNSTTGSTALFGERYPEVEFVSRLKRVQHDRSKGSFMKNLAYGLGFFSRGHWREHPELADAVAQLQSARLVHLYGGGYINTWLSPGSAFLLGMLADAATHFKVRVVATGIGITPLQFAEGEDLAPLRQAMAAFELFELRDSVGYNRLRQIVGEGPALLCGQDDAFVYPVPRQAGSHGARRPHLSGYRSGNAVRACRRAGLAGAARRRVRRTGLLGMRAAARTRGDRAIEGGRARDARGHREGAVVRWRAGAPPRPHAGDALSPASRGGAPGDGGQYLAQSVYYEHKHGAVVQAGSRFRRIQGELAPPETTEQPLAWRDAGWVALKQALARRLYGVA